MKDLPNILQTLSILRIKLCKVKKVNYYNPKSKIYKKKDLIHQSLSQRKKVDKP
jgi:hypothetical protein